MSINRNHQFYKLVFEGILLTMFFSLYSCSNEDNEIVDVIPPSSYDSLKPIGFGENTTGGNNHNITVVTTAEQLAEAVSGANPATIYVQGDITLDNMLAVGSNKSIIGLYGATISNLNCNENAGIFLLKGSNNVITLFFMSSAFNIISAPATPSPTVIYTSGHRFFSLCFKYLGIFHKFISA